MASVSGKVVLAVLESRDRRTREAYGAMVAMYQALVAELVDGRLVSAVSLIERLQLAHDRVTDDVHGQMARAMLAHVLDWLNTIHPDLPAPEPGWCALPPPDEQ